MNVLKVYIRKYRESALRYIPILYIIFTFIFLLLRFPSEASKGVKSGIELCLESLIPSLYPFMVATELLNSTGLLMKSNRLLNFLSDKLFCMPYSFGVFLLSCLGGYPIGATCVNSLTKNEAISKSAGEKMLLFTVNPSINFVLSFVGASLYNSDKVGVLLYVSNILASLILGVIFGRINKGNCKKASQYFLENETRFDIAFTSSVKKAAVSMFYVCAFTVLFSSVSELIEILPFVPELKVLLKCITEVTNGVRSSYIVFSLPFIASALSFGGLSVGFQIVSALSDLKISYFKYIAVRLVSSALSYVFATFLFSIFPVTISTFSTSSESYGVLTSHSVPVSIGLILMTIVLICEDSFFKYKRA